MSDSDEDKSIVQEPIVDQDGGDDDTVESSDDFGNFSDASIEEGLDEDVDVEELKSVMNKNLDAIFDVGTSENVDREEPSYHLQDLIKDERPSVIYEQLVQLDTVLEPFTWSKSSMKSALYHILRIENNSELDDLASPQEPLNDTLFTRLISSLDADIPPTEKILNDFFKYKYIPRLSHRALQSENEQELLDQIPKLISTDVDELESESAISSLNEYHDLLCNAIDLLYLRYKVLHKQENDLTRDKSMLENVVTNLTGHTQRLHRNEVASYNKKKKRQNRFSWIGRK